MQPLIALADNSQKTIHNPSTKTECEMFCPLNVLYYAVSCAVGISCCYTIKVANYPVTVIAYSSKATLLMHTILWPVMSVYHYFSRFFA